MEYTLFNLGDGDAELGLLAEYLYDDRSDQAPPTIFDDDLFLGFRLSLNDAQGTGLLGGAVIGSDGALAIVEVERRFGKLWKLEAEVRGFVNVAAESSLLTGFRNDSFATLRLSRYL